MPDAPGNAVMAALDALLPDGATLPDPGLGDLDAALRDLLDHPDLAGTGTVMPGIAAGDRLVGDAASDVLTGDGAADPCCGPGAGIFRAYRSLGGFRLCRRYNQAGVLQPTDALTRVKGVGGADGGDTFFGALLSWHGRILAYRRGGGDTFHQGLGSQQCHGGAGNDRFVITPARSPVAMRSMVAAA